MTRHPPEARWAVLTGFLAILLSACQKAEQQGAEPAAGATSTIHLASLLDQAEIDSSSAPATARETRRWSFESARPEWQVLSNEVYPPLGQVESAQLGDSLRLAMTQPGPFRVGGLHADLGDLRLSDWETVIVKARTSDRFAGVTVVANLDDVQGLPGFQVFFSSADEAPPLFNDGSAQSYAIPLQSRAGAFEDELSSVAILFAAPGPATVDVLEVTLVPRGAAYLEDIGVRQVSREGVTRHTMYAHAPASIGFEVEVDKGARLDFGLTANRGEAVTYRVNAVQGETSRSLFEATVDGPVKWQQHSIDLSDLAGQSVRLFLEARSETGGSVALWGAPIVSAPGSTERPNIIFYVIDGGDADFMSLYEYGRPTTPFLEELAGEGVLFTRAHSNATWTQPSTASFMTSLHHSVLGGLRRGIHSTTMPTAAVTMAERFRRGGYLTSSFTSNPNAGRIIGTDKGVDVMRDIETSNHSTSSLELHQHFYELRDAYPAEPYWVHFQTTDVHEPNHPVKPYKGRFTTPEAVSQQEEWDQKLWSSAWDLFGTTSVTGFYDEAIRRGGIDRQGYFGTRRDLYDETMLHQDQALQKLVEKLKADAEWENTILVIGSDHGHPAGTFARFGRGLIDPQPEPWEGAMCDAYATRIPLLILWPGTIEGGRRIDEPVSMIDVLPTLLELADLPRPDVVQGQSLAPLLLGRQQELRPVILDEFRMDEKSGEMIGNIEIIDGRWGASLEIGPVAKGKDPSRGRHPVPAGGRWGAVHPYFEEAPRLLLYDLENDPFTLKAVNDQHPDLVRRYTSQLLELWQAHRTLAKRFEGSEDVTMTPEQLEQLRELGYIR